MAGLYNLHIHPIPYQHKPTTQQVMSINNTIVKESKVVGPKQLAEMLAKGHTVVLGVMNGERKKANLIGQQVMMLDFDNTQIVNGKKVKAEGDDYVVIENVLTNPWMQENASFVYKTFSYQDHWQKFRVVIFLDRIIKDYQEVADTYAYLMETFPQADKSTKDSSRIFYGGTESIEINFDNTWSPMILEKKQTRQQSSQYTTDFSKVKSLSKRQASQIMRGYIERERENLEEYGNALSAISVIGKAVLSGEIEEDWARQYVRDLALGNEKWANENETKLNEFLGKDLNDIYTNYTFKGKFSSKSSQDDFDVFKFSDDLIKSHQIIYYKDKIYAKDSEIWQSDENKLLRLINSEQRLVRNQDKEVFHQLEKNAPEFDGEVTTIQLANDFQIENGEIIKGRTKDFTPYLLDVAYNPSAYCEDVDNFLDFLVMDREELRESVEELLGHILLLRGFPHKVFFLVGSKGGNGKSTFLEMLNAWVGDLGSNINLEAFNDPTSVSELEDKIVNIGDDIDASYLDKSMNFKTLASGNTIMIRPIYQRARKLKNTATLIFTANEMPTFRDKTGGIERRLAIIPCDNVVEEADFGMDQKLSTDEAKSYLLNLALAGVKRIQSNGGQLTENEIMNSQLQEYMTDMDSVIGFIEDVGITDKLDKSDVYVQYKEWCEEMGTKPQKMATFTRRVLEKGYEVRETTKLGKKFRWYERI